MTAGLSGRGSAHGRCSWCPQPASRCRCSGRASGGSRIRSGWTTCFLSIVALDLAGNVFDLYDGYEQLRPDPACARDRLADRPDAWLLGLPMWKAAGVATAGHALLEVQEFASDSSSATETCEDPGTRSATSPPARSGRPRTPLCTTGSCGRPGASRPRYSAAVASRFEFGASGSGAGRAGRRCWTGPWTRHGRQRAASRVR